MSASLRLGLALIVCLAPTAAIAAPPEELPLSNEAAMMGGAVRAAGRSAGSFWYNPALLGRLHRSETEANGEVLGLRWTQVPDVVTLELLDGRRETTTLSDGQFVAVPTTVAGVIALSPKWTVGYGLFQPLAAEFSATADTLDSDDPDGETVFQLRNHQSSTRYYGGLGVGYEPSRNFQVGASVFAVFDQTQHDQRLLLARSGNADTAASGLLDQSATVTSFGLVPALGIRGRLARLVHAAASVRAPTFVLGQWIDGTQTVSEASPDGVETRVDALELGRWRQSQLAGWQLGVGLSVGSERWLLNLDLSADTGTRPRTGPFGAGPSFGARVGGRVRVSERVMLGAGAFYDSPSNNDDSLGALSLHRVGGSLGLELRRELELANRNAIEFRTVVAAWYAHGFGTTAGLEIATAPDQALASTTMTQTRARSHLVVLHIGSSLAF